MGNTQRRAGASPTRKFDSVLNLLKGTNVMSSNGSGIIYDFMSADMVR